MDLDSGSFVSLRQSAIILLCAVHNLAQSIEQSFYVLSNYILGSAHVFATILFFDIRYVDVADYIIMYRYILANQKPWIIWDLA